MRIHRTHEILAPWSTGTPVLDAARLAAVRVEPVLRQRKPALALDFYLAGENGDTIVPLVLVDPAVVVDRDRDPLVFPFGAPGDDAFAFALSERIVPYLERLVLGGERVVEHVVTFADAPRFDAARAAGCFGAAPLRDALARLAPYRYARRFARGRSVRIDAPDAIGGWAMLRAIANAGVVPSRRDAAAAAWYGDAPSAVERADVAIVDRDASSGDAPCILRLDTSARSGQAHVDAYCVDVVDPLPLDVGIAFDPAEGPARRWFVVERAPEPVARVRPDLTYTAVGGSAGRIAVVLGRADALVRPSADTDEAHALAAALCAEGFDARLVDADDELQADLVHLVGTRDGRRARAVVDRARRAGVPVAVHAHDEDAGNGGWWGAAVTRYCFEYGSEERDVQAYLALLARRSVSIGAARADIPFAPDEAGAEDGAAALRDAGVVFAATEEEATAIRVRTGRRGPIVLVPSVATVAEPVPIGHLVGSDPFALVHAPIGPIGNQLAVARCAASAAIPLVVTGPVADASYLERVREFGGAGLMLLAGEPSAGTAAALRAAAAVVIDAAWVGDGSARLAAAELAGARLAFADRRRYAGTSAEPRTFDPADLVALTRALGEAWDDALRAPNRAAPEARAVLAPSVAVRAIVRGYAALTAGVP